MIFASIADGQIHDSEILRLDVWDKLVILAAIGLFFALVILCMVCALSPFCWLYNICPFQYDKQPQVSPYPSSGYGATQYAVTKEKPLKGKRGPLRSIKEDYSSEWSDSSGPTIIELKRTSVRSPPTFPDSEFADQPHAVLNSADIEFSLKYDPLEGKLFLKILQVKNLSLNDASAAISPYVRVRFYRAPKQLFSFGKEYVINNLDMEVQTKMQKASENPVFNETFYLVVDQRDLPLYTVRLHLCDFDKFSRHILLGETTVIIKKIDLPDATEVTYTEKLELPEEEDLGEICLGMNYLPTAEKLYLTVVRVRGLKAMNRTTNTTDAYVKVVLMHEGRQLKKVKTVIKRSDLNPEYDETFAFDVPSQELNNVYFCAAVIHANKEQRQHRLIGRMYLGPSFSTDAHAHWVEMTQNQRKQVTCWHRLHC
ncbi:synaptotagmin-B-like [Ylistrum balloti]|uniref:synaptotagmin-B-like n=1 Tax=Ylistrum balloti TaxID=509963 RepID=UPI002905E93D|nr:synaptotagmin-B-like [Ylistrum balloti]